MHPYEVLSIHPFVVPQTGVYSAGSNNMKYVDFAYVGGTQNPRSDPVPKGQLKFTAVLPNGNYDYRYL